MALDSPKLDPESSEPITAAQSQVDTSIALPTGYRYGEPGTADPDVFGPGGEGYYFYGASPQENIMAGITPISLGDRYVIPREQQMALARYGQGGNFIDRFLDKSNLPLMLGGAFLGGASGLLDGSIGIGESAGGAMDMGVGFGGETMGALGLTPAPGTAAGELGLAGPLAAPENVQTFLAGVPEATPGTTLPIGGQAVDITAPGAVEQAAGAGNLIAPGQPSGLPGSAPTAPGGTTAGGGTTPEGGQPAPGAPQAPQAPATQPQAAGAAGTTPSAPGAAPGAPGTTPTPPTAPQVPGVTPPPPIASPTFLDDIQKWFKQNAAQIALGVAGLAISAKAGSKQLPGQAQLTGLGTEAAATAQDLLKQAQAGKLTAGQEAALQQFAQQAKSQIRNYFAANKQFDSTARIMAEQQIDQQLEAMRGQLVQQTLQMALQAVGAATGPLNAAATQQFNQDRALQQALGSFIGGLGRMAGTQAGTTQAPTITGTP